MSHALYSTRLYWAGTRGGIAKLHGRLVQIAVAPEIAGLRIVAIDYVPEIGLRQIMPHGGAWRDMQDHEAAAADALLRDLTKGTP